MNENKTDILVTRIQYLQDHSELTQTEIATRLNIDRSAFSRILSGSRKVSADELSKIADIFGVTTDFLLGRTAELGDAPIAAHISGDLDDLTDAERQEIEDYIEFKKAQYKKRHENENKD